RPAFVAYLTAGYPEVTDTVEAMLALQKGGADIIELGVYSDERMEREEVEGGGELA
ncbi:bifunctional tryptophan synthase trp1, partial [Quaeritorhiza haematococci]